jgi:hypothetical protein
MRITLVVGLLLVVVGCSDHPSAGQSKPQAGGEMRNPFKKVSRPSEMLSHADYNLIFDAKVVEGVPIEVVEIGELAVPSGQIVVCDPLVVPDSPPLTKKVRPGKYPVTLYCARTKDAGDRFAAARLRFSEAKADKWVLALRDGEDIADLKEEGDFFGFPVDAGLGGFFDYQAGRAYIRFIDEFMKKNPEGNIYDDFFAAEFKKNAKEPDNPQDCGDWVNFTLPSGDLNITMFQSGYGDGVYPAYWGMTHEGEIVSLVIDFHVLLLPDE